MIYFALLGDDVVGTCAVMPHGPGTLELAKMAVSPAVQGRGVGRLLGEACIAFARTTDAHTLMLLSNATLAPALHLYEKLGFRHAPMPAGSEYARANVHMVLHTRRKPRHGLRHAVEPWETGTCSTPCHGELP